ncbi:MAG: prepilin-type N-terminal cleavage/methylation domain-containing protein, partial [Chitinophagaceae bacterium]|nr:prepilin-type N-terminal cleavage/methylation domain-containing protein [Rubrivivax sp.]
MNPPGAPSAPPPRGQRRWPGKAGSTAFACRPARGFTLVEVAVVCAVCGVLAAVALPGYTGQLLRAGRADAVDALTRVHAAQARHHA